MAGTRLFVHATFLVEIVFLTCLSVYYGSLPPAPLELGSVIRHDADTLFFQRTGLSDVQSTLGSTVERLDELESSGRTSLPLSSLLSNNMLLKRLVTTEPECTLMVTALDEDPGTHGATGLDARQHHDMIALTLDAVVDETVRPMLDRLSSITKFTVRTRTVAYGQLSSAAKKKAQSGNTIDGSSNSTTAAASSYVVGLQDAQNFWSQHGETISIPRRFTPSSSSTADSCYLDLIIYVPSKDHSPLSIQGGKGDTDVSSEAFSMSGGGRGAVAIAKLGSSGGVTTRSNKEMYAKSFLNAASYLIDYLHIVTGLSSVSPKNEAFTSNQEISALRRELLQLKYTNALAKARSVWDVAESAERMTVTAEAGERILKCINYLQGAVDAIKIGDEATSTSELNAALIAADSLMSDGEMMVQMYFPHDHYLAVFTPLILPLLLPLLLGLAREVKRYKKLRNGEREDDGEEKEATSDGEATASNR